LVPNLGVVRKPTGDGTVFADIPGLIEGAHNGVGLGYDFLRHIERTRLLLHLVDLTAENPLSDYRIIQDELISYGRGLSQRPQIVVLNKLDSFQDRNLEELKNNLSKITTEPILVISAVTRIGLEDLMQIVWSKLECQDRLELV